LTFKNRHIYAINTHLFVFPTAFPAISGQLKSVGEVWMAGAAVILTAAAMPSGEFEISNARRLEGKLSDGHEHDSCSED
jgi:hypothetical protein